MGSATLVRDKSPLPTGMDAQLIVSWQHPQTRALEPIGVLSCEGGAVYRFEYLERARDVEGFGTLLGFPDLARVYESDVLFPLFAQRAMDPRRPDYERYVSELSLDSASTPWEQIARSGGSREGDTIQLFPVPRFVDGVWRCYFLTSGVRYMLKKAVTIDGEPRGLFTEDALEALLSSLTPGDTLAVVPEPDNEWSDLALLVTTEDHRPLGYVPHLLVEAIGKPHEMGLVSVSVEQVNPPAAGWHMRLLVALEAAVDAEFEFFSEAEWPRAHSSEA